MRIGILGGTFDPVHVGHIYIAGEALRVLRLDRVIFVPAGIPPHKTVAGLDDPGIRLELVRRAVADYPQFEVYDLEAVSGKVSYSVDTVSRIVEASKGNEWFFILGIDAFLDIMLWKEPFKLITLCDFAVFARHGHSFDEAWRMPFFENIPKPGKLNEDECVMVEIKGGRQVYFINNKPCDVSSTMIREALGKGEVPKNALMDSILSYIIKLEGYEKEKRKNVQRKGNMCRIGDTGKEGGESDPS